MRISRVVFISLFTCFCSFAQEPRVLVTVLNEVAPDVFGLTDVMDSRVQNGASLSLEFNTSDSLFFNSVIRQIEHVKELSIYSDTLERFGSALLTLENLERLEVTCPKLKTLPEQLGELQNLRGLEIESSKIKGLPKSFAELSNLDYLAIHKADFDQFPEEILHLKNGLYSLHLDIPKVKALPDNFSTLRYKPLEEGYQKGSMELSNCSSLEALPPNIRSLDFNIFLKGAKSLTNASALNSGIDSLELMITDLSSRKQLKKVLRSIQNERYLDLIIDADFLTPIPFSLLKMNQLSRLHILTSGKGIPERSRKRLSRKLPNTDIRFD